MLVVDNTRAAGRVLCSLIVGIEGSFGRDGRPAASDKASLYGPCEPACTSVAGECTKGKVNPDRPSPSFPFGDVDDPPIDGVFGTVDAPDERLCIESRSEGYVELNRGDGWTLNDRFGCGPDCST